VLAAVEESARDDSRWTEVGVPLEAAP
jgi:hypothetical protein